MSKLEYDNLYKFLVSLGIVLIIFPIIVLVYLFNVEPILISELEFKELSEFSLKMLEIRNNLISFFICIFPWIAALLMLFGIILLVCGIIHWIKLQKKLDLKLDAEVTIQKLNLLQMSREEVVSKAEKETQQESTEIPHPPSSSNNTSVAKDNKPNNSSTENLYANNIQKYIEIENLCYNYFNKKYNRKYCLKRNIRIGKYEYDIIGVSKNDNIDLLIEVKYWKTASHFSSSKNYEFLRYFYNAGIHYETITHRNFKCIVLIITPKEELPNLERFIETYYKKSQNLAPLIEIKCLAEESL